MACSLQLYFVLGNLNASFTVLITIPRPSSYYPLTFLAVLLGYFIFRAAGAPFSDYAGYYFGSKALLQGNFQQVYDTYSLNALIAEKGFTGVFVSYTPFPPFTSIVMALFVWLPVAN